jgi:DNA-binding PadR family transcriptional regulator
MNRNALVVLGLLREQPKHGYQILADIRERRLNVWAGVSPSSTYGVINRLEREGYIHESSREREGSKPERVIYEITEAGREHLADQIIRALRSKAYVLDDSILGIAFVYGGRRDEVLDALKWRRGYFKERAVHIGEEADKREGKVPYNWMAIMRGLEEHMSALAADIEGFIKWVDTITDWDSNLAEYTTSGNTVPERSDNA